jgi:tRNA pseudouridine55 synthase
MYRFKRRFKTKKVGYSGTLDPFATGCLIVATGQYTKLFSYLAKTPKTYRATLWLGAYSETLDIEKVSKIKSIPKLNEKDIRGVFESMLGEIEYIPPKYSAKMVDGKRAYQLARDNINPKLKEIKSKIYRIQLLNYSHPFIHFEIEVSEGSYIRSIAQIIAKRLKAIGTLSSLSRTKEGRFFYQNEVLLNPLDYLAIEKNIHLKGEESLRLGHKLRREDFKNSNLGVYFVEGSDFFSIIEIAEEKVKYRLNLIKKGKSDIS